MNNESRRSPRWHEACDLADLEDEELLERRVGEHEVLIVRMGERLVACPARCPHMDEPLAHGFVDGCVLTCTKHLWQWNLDTGEAQGPAELPLTVAATRIADGKVLVDLTPFDSVTPGSCA
jgi:toluene monooxygenase system ferredoxin subunit